MWFKQKKKQKKKRVSQREDRKGWEMRAGGKRRGRPWGSDDCHFPERERERWTEKIMYRAEICFLVSMTTADYHSQPWLMMRGGDFGKGGRERRGCQTESSGLLFTSVSRQSNDINWNLKLPALISHDLIRIWICLCTEPTDALIFSDMRDCVVFFPFQH